MRISMISNWFLEPINEKLGSCESIILFPSPTTRISMLSEISLIGIGIYFELN